MKLILVRHGEAHAINGTHIKKDSERPLTNRGKLQAQATADFIKTHFTPDFLVVSPYVRAKQTMQAIQTKLPDLPLLVTELITPIADATIAIKTLSNIATEKKVDCMVVVCHMNIIAKMDQQLMANGFKPFELAEARVYQQVAIAPSFSERIDGFIPKLNT